MTGGEDGRGAGRMTSSRDATLGLTRRALVGTDDGQPASAASTEPMDKVTSRRWERRALRLPGLREQRRPGPAGRGVPSVG